ncbi:MAG: DUF4143 domain-containing protein [Bacillales bacterium]|jgi:predicted AAA+ superfamily ATPase|nr:DUF4143 domain-containing protein [Bacillales bacterium]
MEKYINRLIDNEIKILLKGIGAVCIEGPKFCGKTMTCEQYAKTKIFLHDTDKRESYEKLLKIQPSLILEGEKPLLIDEWQDFPIIWDTVRTAIDRGSLKGDFLLTGSSSNDKVAVLHSGAGRIAKLRMRPMSLWESGNSNGAVSLKELFNNDNYQVSNKSTLSFVNYISLIVKGGWPAYLDYDVELASKLLNHYVNDLYSLSVFKKNKSPQKKAILNSLVRSLARNILTKSTFETIVADLSNDKINLTNRMVENYYYKLKQAFIIEEVEAWNPHLRSRSRLRSIPKKNFCDPSIACGALRAGEDYLKKDINYLGFLFESLVIRDLRVYADTLDGDVFYYGDATNLDIDAIIQLKDGRWGCIQVKMGEKLIDEGVKEINLLLNKIDYSKTPKPSFCAVITATEYAYKRPDGIFVIPLGSLKN